ncbi:hypothetical protein Scep_007129 [Stephania cephalantha]|uniref:Uncharacterized protein n=1 Tax=Stephania cephalantha TaxID=152367 RepID=A0AAP0PLH3_9MAGN
MFQNLAGQMAELLNIFRAQATAQSPVIHDVQEVTMALPTTQGEQATSVVRYEGKLVVAVPVQADLAVVSEMSREEK